MNTYTSAAGCYRRPTFSSFLGRDSTAVGPPYNRPRNEAISKLIRIRDGGMDRPPPVGVYMPMNGRRATTENVLDATGKEQLYEVMAPQHAYFEEWEKKRRPCVGVEEKSVDSISDGYGDYDLLPPPVPVFAFGENQTPRNSGVSVSIVEYENCDLLPPPQDFVEKENTVVIRIDGNETENYDENREELNSREQGAAAATTTDDTAKYIGIGTVASRVNEFDAKSRLKSEVLIDRPPRCASRHYRCGTYDIRAAADERHFGHSHFEKILVPTTKRDERPPPTESSSRGSSDCSSGGASYCALHDRFTTRRTGTTATVDLKKEQDDLNALGLEIEDLLRRINRQDRRIESIYRIYDGRRSQEYNTNSPSIVENVSSKIPEATRGDAVKPEGGVKRGRRKLLLSCIR